MKAMRLFSMLVFVSLLTGVSGLLTACNSIIGIHGNGNVLKETRTVSSFKGIEVSGAFDILIRQGAVEEVVIESDANLLPVIVTEVKENILHIDTKKEVSHVTTMKVYITVKHLSSIDASGAVDIRTDGKLSGQELSLDASGATDTKLELAYQKLKLDCSGASKIRLSGYSNQAKLDLSGASDIFGYDLLVENYDIEISGAGNAQINVTKKLRAEISGAGSIKYKGTPADVDQSVSGAGSIKKVD